MFLESRASRGKNFFASKYDAKSSANIVFSMSTGSALPHQIVER
jgi:hypothetical protein